MNRLKTFISKMPAYGKAACALTLATHLLSYYIPLIFNANIGPENMTLLHSDESLPLIPGFVYIYVGAFVYWTVSYVYIYTLDKRLVARVVTADTISKIAGILFFVLKPCWLDKGIALTEITGFGSGLLKLIYSFDRPTNLLPSMHCFVSVMVALPLFTRYSGARAWLKWGSALYALLVCASTVLIRQHVFADVWTGILDAALSWLISLYVWSILDRKTEKQS